MATLRCEDSNTGEAYEFEFDEDELRKEIDLTDRDLTGAIEHEVTFGAFPHIESKIEDAVSEVDLSTEVAELSERVYELEELIKKHINTDLEENDESND